MIDERQRWRTFDLENGYLSDWDREWFYHFRTGGYRCIQWIEIELVSDAQRQVVLDALARIHVPGELTDQGVKVFGHVPEGTLVEYLLPSDAPKARA